MRRRSVGSAVAVLVGLVVLAACGGSGDDDARQAPYGDARLVPLLVTADDFHHDLVTGDGRRGRPQSLPLCGRAELPPTWATQASMLAVDKDPVVINGGGESILQFAPGGATRWFATLEGCLNTTDRTKLRFTALRGIGDEAFVSVPAEYHKSMDIPLTIAVVRTGDRVVALDGALDRSVIDDALIALAVEKASAG